MSNMNIEVPENERLPIGARVQIQVSRDKKTAHILAVAPENGGPQLVRENVEREIAAAGVVFGVSGECLDLLLGTNPPYGMLMPLAQARLPQKGKDAEIKYHFSLSKSLQPKLLPDGSVDFKDLGLIQNVRTGDTLCTKTPASTGIPGTDVTGADIHSAPGRDITLPSGGGTKISDDGLQLLAAVDGQVDMANKRVIVMNTFTVKGDVGIGTGNIDFVGNVQVGGNVTAGFKVKALGNVIVNGLLDGGSVEAEGNVIIQNGFNGLNAGTVTAGGDLKCKYLQNCKADAGGNVFTGSIVGSVVNSGGTINVIGAKSQIYNSSLTARHTINCVNAGSAGASRPVTLEVGSDPGLAQRRTQNPKEITEAQKKLYQIDNLIAVFEARRARGSLDADKAKEYETLRELRRVMSSRLAELHAESEDIERRTASSGYGNIVVTGVVKERTYIVIGPEKLLLLSDQTFVRFSRAEGQGITTGPAK